MKINLIKGKVKLNKKERARGNNFKVTCRGRKRTSLPLQLMKATVLAESSNNLSIFIVICLLTVAR